MLKRGFVGRFRYARQEAEIDGATLLLFKRMRYT